jgi:hypothetical protein
MSTLSLQERFNQLMIPEPNTGCWLWIGAVGWDTRDEIRREYGRFWDGEKNRSATHISLELDGRPVTVGKVACHICDFTICVNPEHLVVKSQSWNQWDSVQKGRHRNTKKIHCPQGHLYSKENTYLSPRGQRFCKLCKYESKLRPQRILKSYYISELSCELADHAQEEEELLYLLG